MNENKECFELNRLGNPVTKRSPASAARVALYHYVTKSEEDFEVKSARGGGGGDAKGQWYWDSVQRYGWWLG